MNSKQIAIKYIAEKIDDTRMIFADLEIFKLVLSWSRDCAREFFSTQQSKMFLIHYIDDVALIVDEYLIDRANKMYQNELKHAKPRAAHKTHKSGVYRRLQPRNTPTEGAEAPAFWRAIRASAH